MSTGFTIYIIAQFLVTCAIIYGVAHEEKVIKFEDRVFSKIKRKLFSKKKQNPKNERKNQRAIVKETPEILSPTDCFDYNIFSNAA